MSQSKPNIEEVYSVFQSYQTECAQIISRFPAANWPKGLERAREKLKLRLNEIGLGEHIDWTDRESI